MVFLAVMKNTILLAFVMMLLSACTNGSVSPGVTLVAGINHYHSEMASYGAPERWPERQRMGHALKNTFAIAIGPSQEFNRLVDLDVKRREFAIVLRASAARPERLAEMREELVKMNEEVDSLKEIVKKQVSLTSLRSQDRQQEIEGVATIGLLSLAIESFSSNYQPGSSAAVTKVGPYVVTDLGSFSSVRTPEGQSFRCSTFMMPEEGAGIKCEPITGAS